MSVPSVPSSPRGPARLLATLERLLAITAPTLHETLQQASDLLVAALRADKSDVFLYDRAGDTLVALGTSRTPMGERQHQLGLQRQPLDAGGSAVRAFTTHQPEHQGRADQDPGELRGVVEDLGVRSQIATPLVVAGESRGVLQACSAQPLWFTPYDLQFLTAVAHWLGLVAQRAELIERVGGPGLLAGASLTPQQAQALMEHDLEAALASLDKSADPADTWKAPLVRWKLRQLETQVQETEAAVAVVQASFLQGQHAIARLQERLLRLEEQKEREEERAAAEAAALREAARVRLNLEEKLKQAEATIVQLKGLGGYLD